MKTLFAFMFALLALSCTRPRPVVFETTTDRFDGMILTDESGERAFLVQMKDSTGYIITEGVLDTNELTFSFPRQK